MDDTPGKAPGVAAAVTELDIGKIEPGRVTGFDGLGGAAVSIVMAVVPFGMLVRTAVAFEKELRRVMLFVDILGTTVMKAENPVLVVLIDILRNAISGIEWMV